MVNLPIVITFSRIFLIPLFIFMFYVKPVFGILVFILASSTDLLDGYIARRSRQVTKLGVLLDPIADKLLIMSALIVFVDKTPLPVWIVIIIITREFMVTGLRIVALSKDILMPAEIGGKIKTVVQFIAVMFLLVDYSISRFDLYDEGYWLLVTAMLIGLVSGARYFRLFWKRLS